MKLREQVDLMEILSSFTELSMGNTEFRHSTEAPNYVSVTNAKKLLRILSKYNFLPEKVVPSGTGGITFFYYNNSDYPAMFEVQNDGKVWAGHIDNDCTYLELVDLDNFDDSVIEELRDRIR